MGASPAGVASPGNVLERIADFAVRALIDEAALTPKPGLVDTRGSGAHEDLDLSLMLRSARALRPTFRRIALASVGVQPSQCLRETLARIGRAGEREMLDATGGVNTHRGAIWIVGLLVSAAIIAPPEEGEWLADGSHATREQGVRAIANTAARIASFHDRYAPRPTQLSHGLRAALDYEVGGARHQASAGFPHVVEVAWPALQRARAQGASEPHARVDALLAVMCSLDDTCLLHRAGLAGLQAAQYGAQLTLDAGGVGTRAGRNAFEELERTLLALRASPGGAADVLAATLFLDALT